MIRRETRPRDGEKSRSGVRMGGESTAYSWVAVLREEDEECVVGKTKSDPGIMSRNKTACTA